MATAIEYGLIAAGIAITIVTAVSSTTSMLDVKTASVAKPEAPIVKPELSFKVTESAWMKIEKDADASYGNGMRAVVVKPGRFSNGTLALINCNNPQIDRANNTANVAWFTTTDGQMGYVVLCK